MTQFLSTENAIVGAAKNSFKNFSVPPLFEDRVAEVKSKVDELIEHHENDSAF